MPIDIIFLLGRVLFSALFIGSGIGHLAQAEETQAYARDSGAPSPETTVPLSGGMLMAGGVSVLFGVFADAGALVLLAFLLGLQRVGRPAAVADRPAVLVHPS